MSTTDFTNWTVEQKAEYVALEAALKEETECLAELEAEQKAKRETPEAKMVAKKAELEEKKAARILAFKEAEADKVWEQHLPTYGENRLARIRTVEGSIIMRASTLKEGRQAAVRTNNLKEEEAEVIWQDVILSTVIHPDKKEVLDLAERYPGILTAIAEAFKVLASGVRIDTEKKGSASMKRRS